MTLLLLIPGLAPGVGWAQAVARADLPRAGTLRVSVSPVITTWAEEFTAGRRQPIGTGLPSPVFVRAERREAPLEVSYGISDRVAVTARLPLARAFVRVSNPSDSAGLVLDSLLADPMWGFAPLINTPRRLRHFAGDAELSATGRLGPAALDVLLRFPTGHQDSAHDLFDIATGDDQTDLEVRLTHELTIARRFWLNVAVRAAHQRAATRERRVGPHTTLLIPRGATARLDWDPGDYAGLDVAPMLRLASHFGVGFTAGYFTKQRDRYTFRAAQDSVDVAAALGAPTPASVLDAGTAERRLRLGVALTYLGPGIEGGLSIEQTVSASGARIPAATVFRIVMRASRWPF